MLSKLLLSEHRMGGDGNSMAISLATRATIKMPFLTVTGFLPVNQLLMRNLLDMQYIPEFIRKPWNEAITYFL